MLRHSIAFSQMKHPGEKAGEDLKDGLVVQFAPVLNPVLN